MNLYLQSGAISTNFPGEFSQWAKTIPSLINYIVNSRNLYIKYINRPDCSVI